MKFSFNHCLYRSANRNALIVTAPPPVGGELIIGVEADLARDRTLINVMEEGIDLFAEVDSSEFGFTERIIMTAALPGCDWAARIIAKPERHCGQLLARLDEEMKPSGPFTRRGDPATMMAVLEAIRDLRGADGPYGVSLPFGIHRLDDRSRIWSDPFMKSDRVREGFDEVPEAYWPVLDWFDPIGTLLGKPGHPDSLNYERRRMGVRLEAAKPISAERRTECAGLLRDFWKNARADLGKTEEEAEIHLYSLGIQTD